MLDYTNYLDGTQWPSESKNTTLDVWDMPPQHAVSAMHTLLRWSSQWARDDFEENRARAQIRSTVLGRALTAQALGMRDFAPNEDPSLTETVGKPLQPVEIARLLLRFILDELAFTPAQAAEMVTKMATQLVESGYVVAKAE